MTFGLHTHERVIRYQPPFTDIFSVKSNVFMGTSRIDYLNGAYPLIINQAPNIAMFGVSCWLEFENMTSVGLLYIQFRPLGGQVQILPC